MTAVLRHRLDSDRARRSSDRGIQPISTDRADTTGAVQSMERLIWPRSGFELVPSRRPVAIDDQSEYAAHLIGLVRHRFSWCEDAPVVQLTPDTPG